MRPSLRRHATLIRREIAAARTVVLSFPKAGRSWLCYFLARYLAEQNGEPLDLELLAPGRGIPPLVFVHEHADVFQDRWAPARLLHEDLLVRKRIVVLARDPRDSLVSWWHHKRVREGRPVPAGLDAFADCPVYGIERIAECTALLLDLYERHPGDKLLVTYEGLAADPDTRLREALCFALDGRPLDERPCRAALEASRFENMREWERGLTPVEARTHYDSRFGPRREGELDEGHFKVRRGAVGGFETEMSADLRRRVTGLPHTAALIERLGGLVPAPPGQRYDELQMTAAVGRA